jgi:transcriptional regulator with XRE-family HTH domain
MAGLSERLRARARVLGLSDTEVARRLGLSQSRYANYVAGAREPDFATFLRICKALETTPNRLLGVDDPPTPAADLDALRRGIAAAAAEMDADTLRTAAAVMDALRQRPR